MPHYDLVIVGAGSGNMIVNRRFADWRVAIVESGRFGGTCLNVGCIPTKMYVYPADLAATADDWPRLGLAGTAPRADWPRIRDRIFGRIDPLAAAAREQRVERSPNVTVYETSARFTGPQTLRLDSGE
ncbi:MAG: mycothione reductase, partial [Actinobacteria bacterium]|nr:mycothione reductase [Actinomycetota bacterium]